MDRASGLLSQDARRGTPDWPGSGYSLPDRWKGGRINQPRPKWVQRCIQRLAGRVGHLPCLAHDKPGGGSATGPTMERCIKRADRSPARIDCSDSNLDFLKQRLLKQADRLSRGPAISKRMQWNRRAVHIQDRPDGIRAVIPLDQNGCADRGRATGCSRRPGIRNQHGHERPDRPLPKRRSAGVICCRCLPSPFRASPRRPCLLPQGSVRRRSRR